MPCEKTVKYWTEGRGKGLLRSAFPEGLLAREGVKTTGYDLTHGTRRCIHVGRDYAVWSGFINGNVETNNWPQRHKEREWWHTRIKSPPMQMEVHAGHMHPDPTDTATRAILHEVLAERMKLNPFSQYVIHAPTKYQRPWLLLDNVHPDHRTPLPILFGVEGKSTPWQTRNESAALIMALVRIREATQKETK